MVEATDINLSLIHIYEGIDGVHGADIESVVHGNEMMLAQ